jgi:hypothetical protein
MLWPITLGSKNGTMLSTQNAYVGVCVWRSTERVTQTAWAAKSWMSGRNETKPTADSLSKNAI